MQIILYFLLIVAGIMVATMQLSAQCGCADRFETTFPAAVREAPVVIEGEIKSEMIFFGGEYNDDYTTQKITVYKVLKGDFEAKEVELVEQNISFSHRCGEGAGLGIFILYPSEVKETPFNEIPANLKFKPKVMMGVGCNVVNYNAKEIGPDSVYNPYGINSLKDIKKKVYDVAEKEVGRKYAEIAPMPKKDFGGDIGENAVAKTEDAQAVSIASISPTTITAGTFDTANKNQQKS